MRDTCSSCSQATQIGSTTLDNVRWLYLCNALYIPLAKTLLRRTFLPSMIISCQPSEMSAPWPRSLAARFRSCADPPRNWCASEGDKNCRREDSAKCNNDTYYSGSDKKNMQNIFVSIQRIKYKLGHTSYLLGRSIYYVDAQTYRPEHSIYFLGRSKYSIW